MTDRQLLRLAALAVMGARCVDCGSTDLEALQVDHLVPIKRTTDPCGRGQSSGSDKICQDILSGDTDNLQLLCANCHTKKTRFIDPLLNMIFNNHPVPEPDTQIDMFAA